MIGQYHSIYIHFYLCIFFFLVILRVLSWNPTFTSRSQQKSFSAKYLRPAKYSARAKCLHASVYMHTVKYLHAVIYLPNTIYSI